MAPLLLGLKSFSSLSMIWSLGRPRLLKSFRWSMSNVNLRLVFHGNLCERIVRVTWRQQSLISLASCDVESSTRWRRSRMRSGFSNSEKPSQTKQRVSKQLLTNQKIVHTSSFLTCSPQFTLLVFANNSLQELRNCLIDWLIHSRLQNKKSRKVRKKHGDVEAADTTCTRVSFLYV